MGKETIKDLSRADVEESILAKKDELYKTKLVLAAGSEKNSSLHGKLKKEIARLSTQLNALKREEIRNDSN